MTLVGFDGSSPDPTSEDGSGFKPVRGVGCKGIGVTDLFPMVIAFDSWNPDNDL